MILLVNQYIYTSKFLNTNTLNKEALQKTITIRIATEKTRSHRWGSCKYHLQIKDFCSICCCLLTSLFLTDPACLSINTKFNCFVADDDCQMRYECTIFLKKYKDKKIDNKNIICFSFYISIFFISLQTSNFNWNIRL